MSTGLPAPEAPTISIAHPGGYYEITVDTCPSFPDDGGQLQLEQWEDPDWIGIDGYGFAGSEVFPLVAFPVEFVDPGTVMRVRQLGGDVQFSGWSPPSNEVTAI